MQYLVEHLILPLCIDCTNELVTQGKELLMLFIDQTHSNAEGIMPLHKFYGFHLVISDAHC